MSTESQKTLSPGGFPPPLDAAPKTPPPLYGRDERMAIAPLGRLVSLLAKLLVRARPTRWMMFDAAVACGALALGYFLSPRADKIPGPPPGGLAVYMLLAVVAGNVVGLYDRHVLLSGARILINVFASTLLSVLGIALFYGVVVYDPIGRWILLIAGGLNFGGAFLMRFVAHFCSRLYKIRVLYVGERQDASEVARHLKRGDRHHVLVGFAHGEEAFPRISAVDEISDACALYKVDEIVVGEDYMTRRDVLENCFDAVRHGAGVTDEFTFYEDTFEQVPVDRIREGWFYGARIGRQRPIDTFFKRLLDVILAVIGLALTAPLFLILAVLIPLTSRGSAFYSQLRSGRFGRPFRIYKFRTMRSDAETDRAIWARRGDPRVTPLGRFLRKTRLDEIPQFWNVLRGDMSIVGPRPERPDLIREIEKTVPYYAFRHSMRPGITGLAQIRYPYGASIDDSRTKLQHDLYYIKNFNVLFDLQILLRTITAMMSGSR